MPSIANKLVTFKRDNGSNVEDQNERSHFVSESSQMGWRGLKKQRASGLIAGQCRCPAEEVGSASCLDCQQGGGT